MKKSLYLACTTLGGLFIGFTLLSLFTISNTSVQASTSDTSSTKPVSIKTTGLDPQVVTITVNSAVVWFNQTDDIVRLVNGEPQLLYQPLLMGDVSGSMKATHSSLRKGTAPNNPNSWLDQEIEPGQSYTHTFTTAGAYSYFTMSGTVHQGMIVVQDTSEPLFETVLYMAEESAYSHTPDNSSLDLGVGQTDDFTIETFFYVSDLDYDPLFLDVLTRKENSYALYIRFKSDQPDILFFELWTSGPGTVIFTYQSDIGLGWHHVAAVYDNEFTENEDLLAIFLDGVRVAYSPDEDLHVDWTPGIPNSTRKLDVGGIQGASAGFNIYLEETRISDVVRYDTPTYAIPTEPFTPDSNTRALWHYNETAGSTVFEDNSSYGNTLTGGDGAQTYNP